MSNFTTDSQVDIQKELDRFREKLLDLTNNNRLLNYKKSRTRTIQIVDELPNQIFDRLVIAEKDFSFLHKEEVEEQPGTNVPAGVMLPSEVTLDEEPEDDHELPEHEVNGSLAKRHTDDKLQTDLTEKKLETVLKKVRQEAVSAIEETGVNYLYLALGMLEWTERQGAERKKLSPLILVPIRFEKTFDARRNKYRITVKYSGEEIQQNLCLAKRLENDFGLKLPEYLSGEDGELKQPEEYFSEVAEAFASQEGWSVKREALIGFFHFSKLLMYLDLDPENWQGAKSLDRHPLLRAVVEGTQIGDSNDLFSKDYNIDEYPTAKNITLVKDADSSQHSALCDIAEGKSLVIEGPPGTGKSQTITNAIADALSDNKTVLFVAEKLAALEVVRNNLEKVGLGDFCLELHSEAANPREVFKDLGRRLDAQFLADEEMVVLENQIDSHKKTLNDYLKATGMPAGPHGKPLYELFWRIVELRSRGAELLDDANLNSKTNRAEFDSAIARLSEVAEQVEEFGSPTDQPWHGFFADRLPASGERKVSDLIEGLSDIANELESSLSRLAEGSGYKSVDWIHFVKLLDNKDLKHLNPPDDLDRELVEILYDRDAVLIAEKMITEIESAISESQLASKLVVNSIDESQEVANEILNIARELPEPLKKVRLEQLAEVRTILQACQKSLTNLLQVTKGLELLGFGRIETLRDYKNACFKYRLVSHPAVQPPNKVHEKLFFENAKKEFHRGKRLAEELKAIQDELEDIFYVNKSPEDEEIEFIIDNIKAYGGSWTRILRSSYRKSVKMLNEFKRPTAKKIKAYRYSKLLKQLKSNRQQMDSFLSDTNLKQTFNESFDGLNTDWSQIELSLSWSATARKAGLDFQEALNLVQNRWGDTNSISVNEVLSVEKVLSKELGHQFVAKSLCVNAEEFEVYPLELLGSRLDKLVALLQKVEEYHRSFTLDRSSNFDLLEEDATKVVNAKKQIDGLDTNKEYRELFQNRYRSINTELDEISNCLTWCSQLLIYRMPRETVLRFVDSESADFASNFIDQLSQIKLLTEQWIKARDSLVTYGTLEDSWLRLPGDEEDPCNRIHVTRLKDNLRYLPPWAGFCRALSRCEAAGIGGFSEAIYQGKINASAAACSYDLTLHELIANEKYESYSAINSFSRFTTDYARQQFQKLDHEVIEAGQQVIANIVSQRQIPAGVSRGKVSQLTELGLIRHEVGKQRRFCRIRDLVDRAGRAVQALKPCFMMSPLSIAQYLPAGSLEFDLVVMDEASQIKPEDALGTLIRAKQLIVVGDPKQLPPTSFFDRISESEEEEETTFLDDTESILEVAMKAFPHKRRLRWHYRSQHESLIAFSNEKFYDGDLVVFPSPTTASGKLGMRWHYIEESSFTGGCNPIEANKIAEAIIKHALDQPNATLGVATFNAKQAQAIRDRLDEIVSNDSQARLALENLNDRSDKLFIKNLENVQGDERDVMFISYTYGPDPASGRVMNRFGPMTSEHGWRRLNVLVTRAKQRVEVFSSMKPVDIKGGPDKSRGVNAMKDYLQYAMSGELVDRGEVTNREPDSPFEIAVARVIESMGLKVVPQVGVAGYFVDLGILAPDSHGEFLLGVECDGATYHSSKSARDRDRLREEVIRSRGWNLYRIWSTDWFLNQYAEEERLREAIKKELTKLKHNEIINITEN